MKALPVVAAWLTDNRGRVLICLRNNNKARGGYWEFPGGKVEEGESVCQALEREIREELSITIRADRVLGKTSHSYPELSIELILLEAKGFNEKIRLTDHSDFKWVNPQELTKYNLAPADRNLWENLSPLLY